MPSFFIKVFIYLCTVAIGQGFLLWLGTKGIHPERWIAVMIGNAEQALASDSAIRWVLSGLIGLLGIGLWYLGSWWLQNKNDFGLLSFIVSGVIAGVMLGGFAGLTLHALNQPTSNGTKITQDEVVTMTDKKENETHNVTSHNQSGGVTAHTVNIDTRTQRKLGDELKSLLLRDLSNDRPVQVWGMNGDSESMNFANEIYDELKASGYTMVSESAAWHMFFNPPVFDVKISEGNGGAEWWIVVGPAE